MHAQDIAEYRRVLELNVVGTMLCIKHSVQAMVEAGLSAADVSEETNPVEVARLTGLPVVGPLPFVPSPEGRIASHPAPTAARLPCPPYLPPVARCRRRCPSGRSGIGGSGLMRTRSAVRPGKMPASHRMRDCL